MRDTVGAIHQLQFQNLPLSSFLISDLSTVAAALFLFSLIRATFETDLEIVQTSTLYCVVIYACRLFALVSKFLRHSSSQIFYVDCLFQFDPLLIYPFTLREKVDIIWYEASRNISSLTGFFTFSFAFPA